MSILPERIVVDSCKSKVSEFDIESLPLNQYVLRFQISVDNAVGMAILQS